MALTKQLTLPSGIEINPAYARIDALSGSKDEMLITLSYYVNSDWAQEGKPYVSQEFYTFSPSVVDDSENYHKQGYEYLKTLPEFEQAADA